MKHLLAFSLTTFSAALIVTLLGFGISARAVEDAYIPRAKPSKFTVFSDGDDRYVEVDCYGISIQPNRENNSSYFRMNQVGLKGYPASARFETQLSTIDGRKVTVSASVGVNHYPFSLTLELPQGPESATENYIMVNTYGAQLELNLLKTQINCHLNQSFTSVTKK